DVLPALFHVVLRTDADGSDLALCPDHMLQRSDELGREPPMRDQDHADHRHPFTERRRLGASAASPIRPPARLAAIDTAIAAAAAGPPRLQIRLVISKSGLLLRRAKAVCRSRRIRNRGRTGDSMGDSLNSYSAVRAVRHHA